MYEEMARMPGRIRRGLHCLNGVRGLGDVGSGEVEVRGFLGFGVGHCESNLNPY